MGRCGCNLRMPAIDWRTAYLEQAKSDYAILLKLNRDAAPLCHQLHYLQMTTEKMAKGFLTRNGGARYPKTHNAFVNFVILAARTPEFRAVSRFTTRSQFSAYTTSLLALARRVEDLSPDGEDHPNPEYPWEINGVILLPTEYAFNGLELDNPKMVKLLEFIADCFTLA